MILKNKSTRFFDIKYDLLRIPPDWNLAKKHAVNIKFKYIKIYFFH
jgi:hypothetical protein